MKINYIGKKFGKLTILEEVEKQGNNRMFLCLCDCGNTKIVRGTHMTMGKIQSCGCSRGKDIAGKKFGMLTAVKPDGKNKHGSYKWLCKCDCGNEVLVDISALTTGNTKSCGKHPEIKGHRTHGLSKERIYMIHAYMIDRCYNPSNTNYQNYGGRGIKICAEWKGENGFKNFYRWSIENGYSENLTIDRINVDGDYKPSNCRWATMEEQARNQRVRCTNRSGVSGVTVRNEHCKKKYRATFQLGEKRIVLGSFENLEDAIEMRKQAELKYWGYTKIS